MSAAVVAKVEAALEQLRAGRPVLVVDHHDRENEADVVLAAQSATTEWVAWTIRHSSGYLCAPMTEQRADELHLPLMVPNSQDPRRTAYTVTVDAAAGITTGISAADRAHTLRVLANPSSEAVDLIRPGHVLPLRAVAGGVRHRAGHTEAAVDLCRLAGLEEVGGIAELVNDDGSMMRYGEAKALAEETELVLLSIAELIEYLELTDPQTLELTPEPHVPTRVERVAESQMPLPAGQFQMIGYRDLRTGASHVALVADTPVAEGASPLVRVHSECLTGDAFGSLRCDCGPQLQAALAEVAAHGGAVLYLRGHEGRGIGLLPKIAAYALQDNGADTVDANLQLGLPADRREYGAAAAILQDLGWEQIRLLSNNPAKGVGLRAAGIEVSETVPIAVGQNPHNWSYLQTKVAQMGHTPNLIETQIRSEQ